MAVAVEQVKVTPKKAEEWLQRNTNNRHLRSDLVERIRRDIIAGHWQDTGDTVKFNKKGDLIDGQHRLGAVVKSGKTVVMHVATGVPDDAKNVIDTGVARTARDVLVLSGHDYRNVAIVAAISRLLLTEPKLGFVEEKHRTATTSEVLEFVEKHSDEIVVAAALGAKYYKDIGLMPSVIGAFWMTASQGDAEGAHEFLTSIAERRTTGAGDPRLAFSKRLSELARERTRISQYAYLSMIIRTWNAWKKGMKVQKIPVYGSGGNMIEIPDEIA